MKNLLICFCYLIICCFLQATDGVTAIFPGAKEEDEFFVYDVSDMAGNSQTIKFPTNGDQPDTVTAGKWSGARIDPYNEDSPITKWYEHMFFEEKMGFVYKGCKTVESQKPKESSIKEIKKIYETIKKLKTFDRPQKSVCIINIPQYLIGTEFETSFRRKFRKIAADPVGRVLLYRILLEIRREKDGKGAEEFISKDKIEKDGILCVLAEEKPENEKKKEKNHKVTNKDEFCRNYCRSIYVLPADKTSDFTLLSQLSRCLVFSDREKNQMVFNYSSDKNNVGIKVEREVPDGSSLFHEILCWYQFLRNSKRIRDDKNKNNVFIKYVSLCYFGHPSIAWFGIFNDSIMRITLGTPDYRIEAQAKLMQDSLLRQSDFTSKGIKGKCKIIKKNHPLKGFLLTKRNLFLEGDDLSENAYRISQALQPKRCIHKQNLKANMCNSLTKMCWGSGRIPVKSVRSRAYKLASEVATMCLNLTMHGKNN